MGLSSDQRIEILIELLKRGDGAVAAVKELKEVEAQTRKSKESITQFATSFKAALVAIGATQLIRSSIAAFSEQELAISKSNNALRASGQFSQRYSQELQDLAASLQKVTLFADENILQTEAQLIAFGAARKDIPKLTETILNLASGMGRDLPGATMLMGKALAGEFSTLSRYGIIIDETAAQSEKLAAATAQIQARFGGLARAEAQTLTGSLITTKNAMGELKEMMGEFMLSVLDPYVRKLRDAAEAAKKLAETRGPVQAQQLDLLNSRRAALEAELTAMVQAGRIGPNAADLIKMQVGDVFKGRQAAEPNPPMMTVPGFEKKPVYKTVYDFDAMQAALAQMEDFILPQVDKKPRPLPETPAKTPTEKIVKEAAVTHDALERYLERHAANLTRLDEQRRAQWASVGQDIQREFEESTLNQSQLIELNFERRKQLVRDYYDYEIAQAENDSERIVELENKKAAHIEAISQRHKRASDQISQGMQQIAQVGMAEFSRGLAHTLVDIKAWSEDAGAAFQNFAAHLLQMLSEMILQLLIAAALRSAIFGISPAAGAYLYPKGAAGGGTFNAVDDDFQTAKNGLITAASGVAGVSELTGPTYFPRFNVLAGEAGREMMTVLARPRTLSIGGANAIIGSVGPNRLALMNADDLLSLSPRNSRNAAGGGVLSGGISGGVLTGTAVVEIRPAAGFEARIIDSAIKGAEVRIVYDMEHSSPLAEATKRLVS